MFWYYQIEEAFKNDTGYHWVKIAQFQGETPIMETGNYATVKPLKKTVNSGKEVISSEMLDSAFCFFT